MKKNRKCHLCGQESVGPVKAGAWTHVQIHNPTKANLWFCPGHTAKEITDAIATASGWKCVKADCEENPGNCDLPLECMKDKCQRELDEEARREHLKLDNPPEEEPYPEDQAAEVSEEDP